MKLSMKTACWLGTMALALTLGACGEDTAGGTGSAVAAGALSATAAAMASASGHPGTAAVPMTAAPAAPAMTPIVGDPLEGVTPPAAPADVESKEILARAVVAEAGEVKHVLVAWKELAPVYGPRFDPRAAARDAAAADALAWKILHAVKAGNPIEPIMRVYSEDPGSAMTGRTYPFSADAKLVPPFKDLSMRLNLDESGIVKTRFGWHIIKRVK